MSLTSRGGAGLAWVVLAALLLCDGAASGPPKVPKVFTREVVQDLIDRVDEGANAALLRVPFFVPKHHPCSRQEGLEMVKQALKAESVGSKRWVLLKIIYAFGQCRRWVGVDEVALDAYSEVFASQLERFRDDTARIVNVALADFLRELVPRKRRIGLPTDRTLEAVQRAAQLYVAHSELCYTEPNFGPALKKLRAMKADLAPLNEALEATLDGEKEPSFHVLTRAALVYKSWQPERALELLRQAEPRLPKDNADEAVRFYGHFVDLLVARKQTDDAIAAQKQLVALTGRGQVRLLALREASGDKTGGQSTLSSIDYATIGERELRELVDGLNQERKCGEAMAGLQAYRDAQRERSPGYELWARWSLGSMLLVSKRPDEAKQVANVGHLSPPFRTTMARMYYHRLDRLRRRIAAQSAKPKE